MKIIFTPAEHIGAVWPVIKPLIERVVGECRGRRTVFETLDELLSGATVLWTIFDEAEDRVTGIVTARVCQYDGFKLLGVELVAGDNLAAWEDGALEELIAFAKMNGCRGLEGYGRGAAWARRQKKYGWTEVFRTIEMIFPEEES